MPDFPAEVLALLSQGLGVTSSRPRPSSPALIPLTPPRLAPALVAQLDQLVGSDYATSDHETRLRHALGRSTPDLLRLHTGVPLPAPDLVLAPESHEQIARLLQIASAQRIALTPFGGGTSVVGGLTPETERFQGWVALDLRRLDALVALDEESRVAVLQPGLRGPQAEGLLADRGYTIGHFPQSFQYATMGGFAACSSGQASAGYGRFDELVLGLRVATPAGTLTLGRAPRSAAGPDLRQLMLGSEGALGSSPSSPWRCVPHRTSGSTRAGGFPLSARGRWCSGAWCRTVRCPPWRGSPRDRDGPEPQPSRGARARRRGWLPDDPRLRGTRRRHTPQSGRSGHRAARRRRRGRSRRWRGVGAGALRGPVPA